MSKKTKGKRATEKTKTSSGVTHSPESPDGADEAVYAFSVGDSQKSAVLAVLRVVATNKREALERAQELASIFEEGVDLVHGLDFEEDEENWIHSLRVYLQTDLIRARDGQLEEYLDDADTVYAVVDVE